MQQQKYSAIKKNSHLHKPTVGVGIQYGLYLIVEKLTTVRGILTMEETYPYDKPAKNTKSSIKYNSST